MEYDDYLLKHATGHSNRIEGEPSEGPSFDNHLRATLLVRGAAEVNQLLHPRVLHQLLFEGLPINSTLHPGSALLVPGEYRQPGTVVYIVQQSNDVHTFPAGEHVRGLMNSWCMTAETMHQHGMPRTHEEMRWKFHAWFESIHPFVDGNGRVGRLLWWNMAMIAHARIEIIEFAGRQVYYDLLSGWREVYGNKKNMNPFS